MIHNRGGSVNNYESIVKTYVTGLVVECPQLKCGMQCSLFEVRTLALRDRVKWVDTITHQQRLEIASSHKNCLD